MKIILQRDIANLGKRGDVKDVAEGYAMNVLIKKGDALHATATELAKWKQKEEVKANKKERATSTFAQLLDSLRQSTLIITGKKTDHKGQLFASIKETDIADAIYRAVKMSIDPKQIVLTAPIKSLGTYQITLRQGEKKEAFQVEVR